MKRSVLVPAASLAAVLGLTLAIGMNSEVRTTVSVDESSALIESYKGYPRQKNAARKKERADRYDAPESFQLMWEARREGSGALSPAQVNFEASQSVAARGSAGVPAWGFQELGPGNFGGRSRGMLVHPSNTNRLLFSSVTGGLWRSEDAGNSWTPVADFIANLAVGSIAQDPDDVNRVFIGTGEGFFNGDAARGAGIFVSNDFGTSWSQLPSTNNPDFHYVNRIALVPSTDTIVAATRSGLWRSTDLGGNWTRVAAGFVVDNRGYTDVKTDPGTPNRLLAAHFGSAGGLGPVPQIQVTGLPPVIGVQMGYGPPTSATPLNGQLAIGIDTVAPHNDGCEAFAPGSLTGRLVLIDRGTCPFTTKSTNAQNAGAAAVILVQNVPDAPFAGGGTGTWTIPSIMISQADGNLLKETIRGGGGDNIFRGGFEDEFTGPGIPASLSGPATLTNYLARSTDGGASWTQLSLGNGLPNTNIGRSEIAWGPGGVAYAAFATSADITRGLWRSSDGGLNWTQTASTTAFIERQGWYDLVLAVAPNDANKVIMGAVDQFITTDGGATITKNSFWNPGAGQMPDYIHADHHGYLFKPGDPNTIYTQTDGGVQVSTDGGLNYRDLNFGLNASMPNNISVSPNGRVVTGTQDNGSHLSFGSDIGVFIEWSGGDGGNTAADQQDSNFFYSSRPNGDFFGTGTAGNTEADLPLLVVGTAANALFYAPIAIDPNNGNRLMVGVAGVQFTGTARSLGGASFTQMTMPPNFGALTNTLTISPLDGSIGYAGSTTGAIVRITGLGTTNTVSSIQGNLPLGSDISQILVDLDDANHLYVVLADYGSNRVWETFNGGSSWSSIHTGLPDVPFFSIAQVPGVTGQLVAGSEIGLWFGSRTGNGPVTWSRFNYGIPYTRITGITRHNGELYFSVYGRSNFKANRSPLSVTVAEVRNDTGGCGDADGILDEGQTAIVPVTVRNLSNQSLSNISVGLGSSNAAIGAILPQVVATLAANASSTLNFNVSLGSTAACPDSTTLTATATVNGLIRTAARTIGLDQNRAVVGAFTDGAESAESLMVPFLLLGAEGWVRTNTQANTGSFSYFAADPPSLTDKQLTSPWFDVSSAGASLSFALRYLTEGDATQRWDGVVLEGRIRTGGIDGTVGPWFDLGANSTVPYDGLLFNNTPLGPARRAWSGDQQTWRTASVPLGSFMGSTMQFRFHFVSDAAANETGFWLDDINVGGIVVQGLPTCDTTCN